MKRKYIGKIYDGRWEVIRFERYGSNSKSGKFVLRNTYNGSEVTIQEKTLRMVDRGETTISSVIFHKIRHSGGGRKNYWFFGRNEDEDTL